MNVSSTLVLTASILVALPAAAPSRAPVQLKYSYAVYRTKGSTGPVTQFTGPGTGTMTVTILGSAADGGTNVEAQDFWWNTLRPRQAVQCEVYATGSLKCARTPALSDPQLTVLPLLAQHFTAGTTRTSHWSTTAYFYPSYNPHTVNGTVTYTTAAAQDGNLTVTASGTYVIPSLGLTYHNQATIQYDSSKHLPALIHNVRTGTTQSVFDSTSVDAKLIQQ